MTKNDIKVLLLFPPTNKYAFGEEWEETDLILPPLGLLYLASPLIKKGYDVEFIDLNVDRFEKKEFDGIVEEKDFILISCYTSSLNNTEKLIKGIREINKKTYILCGGPHCNIFKKMPEGADYSIIGEAERNIDKLLESIWFKKSLKNFPGLIYKKEGNLTQNPGVMLVNDLDLSENPAIDLIKNKNYGKFAGLKIRIAPILSSRGCPHRCSYCTFKLHPRYRERSVNSIFNEIKQLEEKGYKFIFFSDDNFLFNKHRVEKMMDKIIEEKIKIKFVFQARVDTVDYGLYKKLRKAGVILILFGIENACQDVLDFYNKQVKVDKIREAVEIANKVGIMTVGYLMIGSPIETRKHFEINKRFFSEIPLDLCTVSILNYAKGTKLWEDAYKKKLIEKNQFDVLADEKLSNFSYKELQDFKENFIKEFYSNPLRLIRIFFKTSKLGLLPYFIKMKKIVPFQ